VTRPEPEIRLLTCTDALAYRDIRLEGLRQNPEAFASTFEDERDRPMDWFKELITQSRIFGAVLAQALVGVERLIDAAVAHASGHVEQLQLAVVTENEAARRLYAKAGFIEYGHQINALKHGGRYYDDILMVKFLGA
jgi:hypothetical protein